MKKTARISLIIAATLGLALPQQACTFETLIGAGGYALYKQRFAPDDVNLVSKNQSAADYLTQPIRTYITATDIVEAQPLISTQTPDLTSELARRIPAQVGARLMELGYAVDLSRVAHEGDTSLLNANQTSKPADYVMNGTYYRAKNNLEISLRIVQASTQKVIGMFEYDVPYSREIKKLAEPEPQIFILNESD